MLVQKIFETIKRISEEGMTLLLVEQNAKLALEISHRGYVMKAEELPSRIRPRRCSRIRKSRSAIWADDMIFEPQMNADV